MYLTNNSCTKICEKQAFLISAQIIGEQNHTSISIFHTIYDMPSDVSTDFCMHSPHPEFRQQRTG